MDRSVQREVSEAYVGRVQSSRAATASGRQSSSGDESRLEARLVAPSAPCTA